MYLKTKHLICSIIAFSSKASKDNVPAYSAHASFFLFISAFPFVMVLMTFIKYTPLTKDILLQFVNNIAPKVIGNTLVSWINEIYHESAGILSISVILTLWSASKGFIGIINSLNRIYGVHYNRNYFFKRLFAMLYTLILLLIIFSTLILFVFGDKVKFWLKTEFASISEHVSTIVNFRLVIAIGVFFLIFLIMYTFIPNRKSKFRYELPGAVFTTSGWLLFSALYSVYVNNVNMSKSIYGSLTTIVLLMLWLYFCMYIMFIGAEINVLLQNDRDHDVTSHPL